MAAYAGLSLVVIVAGAVVFGLVFPTPAERAAIRLAALVAFVVQNVGFAIAARMSPARAIVGWGIGALLSLATLVTFAFVANAQHIPLTPALIALATFLFVTEVFEPLVLPT